MELKNAVSLWEIPQEQAHQCSDCRHSKVCKHKDDFVEAMAQKIYIRGAGPFKHAVRCSEYVKADPTLRG